MREMDDERDEYAKAIHIGGENRQILLLAAGWCTNISYTKGPFGVGLIEEMTNLPVTGGSLRCDFAKAPSIFGMQLKETAVGFYEQNCIGCADRVGTEATEHLGTWADARIAGAERAREQAEDKRRQAEEASRTRAASRRLVLGQSEPATQSILDLLDRADSVDRDQEAEQLLVKHAEMAPGDFSDPLVEHLTTEAMAIGNSAFLEAAFAIFERQGRPSAEIMVNIAFQAIAENVAAAAAGRIIAAHAQEFDGQPRSMNGLVKLAAGEPDQLRNRRIASEPAALLRFYDCEAERATRVIGDMLDDPDVWVRAAAGHAAERLIAARPAAGVLLLPALLDSLRHPDASNTLGDPFAAAQIASVVADIFVASPQETDEQLAGRLLAADPTLAPRLWRCYERARPSRFREHVPQAAVDTIIQRSLLLLAADLDREVLRDVADNLSHICRQCSMRSAPLIRDLVRLLILSASRFHAMDAKEPTQENSTFETFLAFEGERVLISTILNRLQTALKTVAKSDPNTYVTSIDAQWNSAEAKIARVWLLDVLQEIVHDQETFDLTLPLLDRSSTSSSTGERAAALRVVGAIRSPDVSVPEDLSNRVLEAFHDEYLIVQKAAIRAAHSIEIPGDKKPMLIHGMYGFTVIYGPSAVHSDDVGRAIGIALRLAAGESYEEAVGRLFLEAISQLPSGEAADHLRSLSLEDHPSWCKAAVSALRTDSRPAYRGIGDSNRKFIFRRLATHSSADLSPHFSELMDIASQRLPHTPWWSGAVADLLALHHEHGLAAELSDRVVEAFPDTREQRPARVQALQVAFGHKANAAASSGGLEAQAHALEEWSGVLAATDMNDR